MIDSVPFISRTHKDFYKYMLYQRFEKIIKESYKKLMEKKKWIR